MKTLFCAVLVSLATVAVAQTPEGAKYMRFTMSAEPMVQVNFASAELCRAYDEASKKQVAEGMTTNGIKFACSETSVASLLPYEAVLRDEFFGGPVSVSGKTELLCLNSAAELLKLKDTKFARPVFTSITACKLKS